MSDRSAPSPFSPLHWLSSLDRILRGETTSAAAMRHGDMTLPVGGLSLVLIILAMVYGACMGVFSLFNPQISGPTWNQLFSSTLKMPLLFLLTLLVTFPSLYVFNALVGSRLSFWSLVKLMCATMGVTLATLASFGPIVAFFSVTTRSYSFIVLLNVIACAVAGMLGLMFLLQTLHRLTLVLDEVGATGSVCHASMSLGEVEPQPQSGPLDAREGHVFAGHTRRVFKCWIILFGLVGSQMGWVLRPFIGNPATPFAYFRTVESNFFEALWNVVMHLMR